MWIVKSWKLGGFGNGTLMIARGYESQSTMGLLEIERKEHDVSVLLTFSNVDRYNTKDKETSPLSV